MRRGGWRALLALVCAGAVSCGAIQRYARRHALYHADGAELARVRAFSEEVARAIASHATATLTPRLDPDGRKALLTFAANLAYENSAEIKQWVDLAVMAVFLVMAAGVMAKSCPIEDEDIERGIDWLVHKVQAAAAAELGDVAPDLRRDGGLELLAARIQNRGGVRALAERLQALEGTVSGCRFDGAPVSFRAWLIRHASWGLAESSHTFRDWKGRIDQVHFAHLACDGQDGLLVLTSYRGALELAEWRFVPSSEWPAIARRIARAEQRLAAP
jgi:hypothetical protein